jgi:hypothetical protein
MLKTNQPIAPTDNTLANNTLANNTLADNNPQSDRLEFDQAKFDQAILEQVEREQCEAIVDLLLLGMHADGHISLLETDLLDAEIASLSWDKFHSSDIYLQRAVPKVRATIGDAEQQTLLLQSIGQRLANVDVKADAIERFSTMLAIDGLLAVEEVLLDQAIAIIVGA